MKSLSQKVFSDNLKVTSGQVILRVFSILFLIFYARVLTPFELSILPVFAVLAGISTLLFEFGLFPTLVREVPKLLEKDREKAISLLHTSSLIIAIGVAIFSTLTFLFSSKIASIFFKEPEFAYLIELMSIGFFLTGLNDILTADMRATSEFGKLTLRNITFRISQRVLGIALFFIWGIRGLIIGFNLGIAIGVIMSIYFLRRYLFTRFRWYPIKELLKFSFPYYIEGYLHYFRNQGDQLIVGAFLSPAHLSAYYIARRLFDNLDIFRISIDQTITPALSKLSSSGAKRVEESFTKISILFPYFVIPLCFLAASLSFAFVNLAGGEKYLNATIPAIILCFTLLLYFFMIPLSRSIFVLGNPVERLKITAIHSFLILLFLILLTRNLGILGVALSRLLAVIVTLIYAYFALRKLMVIKFDSKAVTNSLFASMVMASIISFAQIIYYKLYLVPLYAAIGILVFFFLFVKMLRKHELELIKSVLPMRIKGVTQILYRLKPSLKVEVRVKQDRHNEIFYFHK